MKPYKDLTIFLTLLTLVFGLLMIVYMVYQMSLLREVMAADYKINIIKEPYDISNNDLYIGSGNRMDTGLRTDNSNKRGISEKATVTAYSEIDTCPNRPCRMANGKIAQIGDIACPRALKLDTKVEIEGTIYTCSDRTALRVDGRYDIWTGTGVKGHLEAIKWGKRRLEVKIIK